MLTPLALLGALVLSACGGAAVAENSDDLTVRGYLSVEGQYRSISSFVDAEVRYQETLAACIQQEGFEYIVDLSDVEESNIALERLDPDASLFEQHIPDEDGTYGTLALIEPPGVEQSILEDVDLNLAYINSLDETTAAAYTDVRFMPGGCEDQADEASGIESLFEVTDQASEVAEVVFARMEASQELRDVNSEWSSCFELETGINLVMPVEVRALLADEAFSSGNGVSPDFEAREREFAEAATECGATGEYVSLLDETYLDFVNEELATRGLG